MLWSLTKLFLFIAVAVAIAFGVDWVLEKPGNIQIDFAGQQVSLTPIEFAVAIAVLLLIGWLIFKALGFGLAVIRFIMGDETAISRFFRRSRERRGYEALSGGMIALASGDAKVATKKAAKAEKLLRRPEVTGLVNAHAAELAGDTAKATTHYKKLLEDNRTRYVAITGLMKQQLDKGDTDRALALAKKAFALQPGNPGLLKTLFELQTQKGDWAGARDTLNASLQARLLPRDVGTRRDAVLSLADARVAEAEGNETRAQNAALQANKMAPTLVPAAAMASRFQAGRNAMRKANKALTMAWAANPHPELAEAFAAIAPDETPEERRRRFETLTAAAPDDAESRLLTAELALAAEDFPGARKALGDLAETAPTNRSLALMAAIERGQGAPDAVVRGWLAKALDAPHGPQWVCGKCNHVHAAWEPVCDSCGAFDTMEWTTPSHADGRGMAQSAMLPLIVGEDKPEPVAEEADNASAAQAEIDLEAVADATRADAAQS